MADLARMIDESPLMKLLTGIVFEDGPAFLARGVSSLAQGAANMAADVGSVFGSVRDTLIGGSMTMGSSGPEISQSRGMEVSAPSRAVTQDHHVDMADIGTFAPPSFNGIGIGGGGRSMG